MSKGMMQVCPKSASADMDKKYDYDIMQLQDTKQNMQVFVPNCTTKEAFEVFRFLKGYRKDFPCYNDGSLLITGIDEEGEAWCRPKIYQEAYAPPSMTCIVRKVMRPRNG